MPLITNPDGSHRFVADQNQTSSFDIESLVQARQRPSIGQPIQPPEWNIQPLPGYPGVSYFMLVLGGEGRGVYRQRGSFDKALSDYGEGDLVYDDYEVARLQFFIGQQGLGFDTAYANRLCGAYFGNRQLITTPHDPAAILYEDTGTAFTPSIAGVGTYVPQAGASRAMCMRAVQVNQSAALLIGYLSASVYTLQIITQLNPFVSSGVINNTGPTWGVCQTPVDGDSLQIYMRDTATGTCMIKMVNTNIALGSATFRDGVPLPDGGYTVGLVNLDGNPEVFYVVSANGQYLFATPTSPTSYDYARNSFRGKLMRVDLRALTIYPVATALDFVLYATSGDANDHSGAHDIFYCNGTDHQYMVHGADIPILPSADRPPLPANYKYFCGGHWFKEGRFYWEENVYDAAYIGPTFVRRWEFDPALGRYGVRPASRLMNFSPQVGITSMGGPNLPWSPNNGNLISRSRSEWYWNFQPPRSRTGYSYTHQDGGSTTSGPPYEPSGYRRWPRLRPPGRPGAVMAISRITGPPPANLRTGSGTEAGMDFHNTRVEVVEAHTQPAAIFYGDDGVDSDGTTRWRPAIDYPDNDSWADELDITVTAYRDTLGANAARYTPNPGPIVVEGYLREIGAPPPSRNILNWAADRIAADDLSRPLL